MKVDPDSTADLWVHNAPKGKTSVNEMEVWEVVGKMSDQEANLHGLKGQALGIKGRFIKVYEKDLCGGLLSCSDDKMGTATAGISPEKAEMVFFLDKQGKGTLLFIFVPLLYLQNDLAMLAGFLHHELRHAMDYLDTGFPPENDYMKKGASGEYEVDPALYARNIYEMRAHAEQAMALVKMMGGPDNAKKAIKESTMTAGLIPEIVSTMMAFIDKFYPAMNESIDLPAIVVRAEDYDVRKLVAHLQKAIEAVRLSNNVRKKA